MWTETATVNTVVAPFKWEIGDTIGSDTFHTSLWQSDVSGQSGQAYIGRQLLLLFSYHVNSELSF